MQQLFSPFASICPAVSTHQLCLEQHVLPQREYKVSAVLQVGNETLEKGTWTRPENETQTGRPAYYMTTYNGTSDLAGQISAAFSATAMVFQDSDPAYYNTLMNNSTLVYAAGARNRAAYTSAFLYPCATDVDSTDVITTGTPTCLPGDELFEGAMLATYNSTSYLDDLAWAAS